MRSVFIMFYFFVLPACLLPQEVTSENELSGSLLWEISRDDIASRSYIFGTNHLISSSFIDTSAVILNCINSADIIITEVESMQIDTAFLMNAMKMKKDEYYSFSESEDEEYLVNFFRNDSMLKAFADIYFILKPMAYWLIYFYSKYITDTPYGNTGFTTLDGFFMAEAQKKNKELIGLESMEEQISYFMDSIAVSTQLKILLGTIRINPEDMDLAKNLLDTCYLSQDLTCMSSFWVFGSKFKKENMMFTDNRNLLWVKKLPAYINYKSAVIAVGAGHLPGENGLISLLKKQGYNVKPLRF